MTFVRKFSGDRTAPIVCAYTCPAHGPFTAEVQRDERGEAPDLIIGCGIINDDCMGCGGQPHAPGASVCTVCEGRAYAPCQRECTWTPSAVVTRVRRIEVARGKWEKPEQKTYLDTRELGEGQDPDEFWKKREKVWDEERHKLVKDLAR